MKLSQFKFDLPRELIADHPHKNRDEAKMMVVNRKDKTIEHKRFKDVLDYFSEGDVFVINNTSSFSCQITWRKRKNRSKN